MKLGLIVLVFGIAACDAGAVPQQAPPTAKAAPTTAPAKPPVITPPPPKPHPHEVLATLQRTACYGTCPIYTMTVYRDGVVEYDGVEYVKTKGKATGRITLAQVDAIDTLFVDNHYTSLHDAYEKVEVTDTPSTNTSYRALDGHVKHIGHYHGDRDAPAILSTIENGLDELVGIEQWIGTRGQRQRGAR
jgi:Domain of unknown function (DUF6438)